MLYKKEIPRGIDVPIQNFQTYLYANIPRIWTEIDVAKDYESFGRAYRNQKKGGGYIPEVYVGSGNYREVLFSDKVAALSFFGVEDVQRFKMLLTANVYIIFCVNLTKLYPEIKHRADEEARRDIINLSGRRLGELTGLVTGIDAVFRGYDVKNIKYKDMHPSHCFRLNYTVKYEDACP